MSGYYEAVDWFRVDPERVRDLDDVDNRSAAIAIVDAVLAFGSVSPDDAHTTTETWTEYRVTYAETDDVDLFEDLASAEHWGQFIGGDTGARVESREVTVTRTETAWTEAQP